jgi:hypothetical protein
MAAVAQNCVKCCAAYGCLPDGNLLRAIEDAFAGFDHEDGVRGQSGT